MIQLVTVYQIIPIAQVLPHRDCCEWRPSLYILLLSKNLLILYKQILINSPFDVFNPLTVAQKSVQNKLGVYNMLHY